MADAGAASFGHPSPHKHRTSVLALVLCFFGGPFAWTGQLLVSYGLTSYVCYPGPTPRDALPPGWGYLSPGLTVLGVVALAIALVSVALSWRNYARTREEMQGHAHDLLDVGEGRSRFLALCGLITAGTFVIVIAFNMVSLYLVPPCTR